MLQQLAELREPVLITQNGDTRPVLRDVASDEVMQETLALLKLADHEVDDGQVQPIAEAIADLRGEFQVRFKR